MATIREVATITSKGQITLPKPIRQALGVGYGDKVAFDLHGSQVIISRADEVPPGAVRDSFTSLVRLRRDRIIAEAARLKVQYPIKFRK